jgi:uncharacterized protein YegP (UPF0339 family)
MAKTTSFQVYQDKKGEFRFNLIAKNGEPVAQSSEGYTTKAACMGAVKKMREWTATDVINVVEKNAPKAKAPAKKVVAKKAADDKATM